MAASTATLTTARDIRSNKTARLKVEAEKNNGSEEVAASAPPEGKEEIEVKEHDFFWTYTEEPHRTRRMAIIKAHPEVGSPDSLSPIPTDKFYPR
jgi:sphingolipid delta-4 desaturase